MINKRRKAIQALRCQRIKEGKTKWYLFCFSILSAFICPIIINTICCDIFYPIENALLTALSNISVGYLSGFLVYVLGSFLPSTRKEVDNKDSIFFNLYMISEHLKNIDLKIAGDNETMTFDDYNTCFYNFLVADAKVKHLYKEQDALDDDVYLNNNHFAYIEKNFSFICQDVNSLITSYGREMKTSEIETLTKVSHMYAYYVDLKDKNTSKCDKDKLVCFIQDFDSYWHLMFRHLCDVYKLYKYCDYEISIKKIDFKNGK